MAIQSVAHNEILDEVGIRDVLDGVITCDPVEYKWERRGDILCLVKRINRMNDPAELDNDSNEETIHAALRADTNGCLAFCAADTLSPELISVCLCALTRHPGMETLRLSGHLTEQNVPALCRLLEDSNALRSFECRYANLPKSLLENVSNSLDGNSSVSRVELVSDGLTSEHMAALFKVISRLPCVTELSLVSNLETKKDTWLSGMIELDCLSHRKLQILCDGDWNVEELSSNVDFGRKSLTKLRCVKNISLTNGPSPTDILEEFQSILPDKSRLELVDLFAGNDGDLQEEWVVEWSLATGFRVCLNFVISD